MGPKGRDDFSQKVKDALAKRAHYFCSNRSCRRLTLKPSGTAPDRYLYIGKACHITAASEGGPRFDPDLSEEHRSGAENGIYLCPSCGELIDKNQGRDFSVVELRRWKQDHEAWVSQQHSEPHMKQLTVITGEHRATGIGKVTGLEIRTGALLKPGTKVSAHGIGGLSQ